MKPAKNTRPSTGADNPANSTNSYKQIGINKLGTLLSSQTTDTFEYFSKQFAIQSANFFCFAFLRCDVYSLFHSFSLCKSGLFSRYSLPRNESAQHHWKLFFIQCFAHEELLLSEGGLSPLSGGDSEDITRSPAAVQIGCGGACNEGIVVLVARYLHGGQVLFAPAQQQVFAVQQLGPGNHGIRVGHLGVVDIRPALANDPARAGFAVRQP